MDSALAIRCVAELTNRQVQGNFRQLKDRKEGIDFYSNDYLGLARNEVFLQQIQQAIEVDNTLLSGATGSRLISGNSPYFVAVEHQIAQHHQVESALLFPSGYNANVTLLSTFAKKGDTIIVDELGHRSILDGCRLSFADKRRFKHNDLADLEKKLQVGKGNVFVYVESLYSMDGDFAPLQEIWELTQRYNAHLIVDEAHTFGVFGLGLVHQANLHNKVFATVVTYGKAMGQHGACVLASQWVKDYLINFSSSFIYSTGLPDLFAQSLAIGYRFIIENEWLQQALQQNIALFRASGIATISDACSPIQVVSFGDNQLLKNFVYRLEQLGINAFAVMSPTVGKGQERIRLCIHSFNTPSEIEQLVKELQQVIKK